MAKNTVGVVVSLRVGKSGTEYRARLEQFAPGDVPPKAREVEASVRLPVYVEYEDDVPKRDVEAFDESEPASELLTKALESLLETNELSTAPVVKRDTKAGSATNPIEVERKGGL